MESANKQQFTFGDIAGLGKAYLVFLQRKLYLLLVALIIGLGLGIVAYQWQESKYDAATTFILEEKTSSVGGLAGIASQFGFDVGSLSGGGSIFAGDNILDILRSKKIVYKVLLTKVDSSQGVRSNTLADLFLEFKGWKKKWHSNELLKEVSYAETFVQQITPLQDSILNEIHKHLLKRMLTTQRFNKKGSIIQVVVTASNSTFARIMTERLVDEAARLYLNIKTGTAQTNITNMQRRSDSLLFLLNRKSYAAAASQPLDINPGIRSAIVPVEIATRDKTVLATLYAEVTKNLETGKLLLSQQTPIIQMLDRPGLSLEDKKIKLPLMLVFCTILMAVAFIPITLVYFLCTAFKGNK